MSMKYLSDQNKITTPTPNIKVVEEVKQFIYQARDIIATHSKRQFLDILCRAIKEKNVESVIQQLFLTAFIALQKLHSIPYLNDELGGLAIFPEEEILQYRVDFSVLFIKKDTRSSTLSDAKGKWVIVECDSQEWHERTEEERRYEKARDRALIKVGYTVFHFTGKEIMQDPFLVASEVLAWILNKDQHFLLDPIRIIQEGR